MLNHWLKNALEAFRINAVAERYVDRLSLAPFDAVVMQGTRAWEKVTILVE